MRNERSISTDLLQHSDFVRELARRLTKTDLEAEDVEQDVWLAAYQQPPASNHTSLRAWFSTVARNIALKRTRRSQASFSPLSSAVEPQVSEASHDDLLMKLIEVTLGLPENYKSLILLRFYEGLPVGEIAKKVGKTPASTRHHLSAALRLIREQMNQEFDDKDVNWRQGLVLACSIGADSSLLQSTGIGKGIGLVVMKSKTVMVAVAICVSFLLYQVLGNFVDRDTPELDSSFTNQSNASLGNTPRRDESLTNDVGAEGMPTKEADTPREPKKRTSLKLHGKLKVEDHLGAKLEIPESGSFPGVSWRDGQGSDFVVHFRGDQWSATVEAGNKLTFDNVRIGGIPVFLRGGWLAFPADKELVLNFGWKKDFLLHVIDQRDRQELKQIEVRALAYGYINDLRYSTETIARDFGSVSPMDLGGRSFPTEFLIRSKGYSWQRVELNAQALESQTIELVPEAVLHVNIMATQVNPHTRVYVVDRHGVTFFSHDLVKADELHIDGLPPGKMKVCVDSKSDEKKTQLTWTTFVEVELTSGETSKVTIDLDQQEGDNSLVPLAGTLVFHESWGAPVIKENLKIECLQSTRKLARQSPLSVQLKIHSSSPRTWSWDAGQVLPGRYEAFIMGPSNARINRHFEFNVPEKGDLSRELRVGAKATVRVRIRDEFGQFVTEGFSVDWYTVAPLDSPMVEYNSARVDVPAKAFVFTCPTEKTLVSLSSMSPKYKEEEKWINVASTEEEVEFVLVKNQGLAVKFVYQQSTIDADTEINLKNKLGDLEEPTSVIYGDEIHPKVGYYEPGQYTLSFGKLIGFKEIPDRKIEIQSGVLLELKVVLEKE